MSENEAVEELFEHGEKYEESHNVRKRDWVKLKNTPNTARKCYQTVVLIMVLIAFTLFMKVFPFGLSFRNDVILSWQFITMAAMTFLLFLYRLWVSDSVANNVSFVELDERKRNEKLRAADTVEMIYQQTLLKEIGRRNSEGMTFATDITKPGMVASGFNFVDHMRAIIESLDKQIDYAEEKASRLLEAGRTFVKTGILLYVSSIVFWQTYLYYINFDFNPGVIVGMVSTTAIFLVMEFLGAWYLKQYRHYGDSAFSYMKVRSSYNKYMLAYCAIAEFGVSDPLKSKEDMLLILAESEKWPELKDINANDFNYMLQSIESMGVVFEKFKGVFMRSNSTGNPS